MASLRLLEAIVDGRLEEIREAAQQFSRDPQCAKSKLDIIAALVDRNDDEITRLVFTEAKISLQPDSRNGRTLLHDAAEYGNPAVVRYLLSQRLDVNAKCNEGSTPLHLTTDCAIAELLIQHGADINQVNGENETLLHIALRSSQSWPTAEIKRENDRKIHGFINFILQQNPNTSDRSVLKAALYSYFESEQLEVIIESLLKKGFSLSDDDICNSGILWKTVSRGLLKFIKWLLNHGSDPTAVLGSTISTKNEEILVLLIDHGANVRDESLLIRRALDINWFKGFEILLDHGANINEVDEEGRSLLHESHSVDTVRMLVSKGADIHLRDNLGRTPLYFADTIEVAEFYLSRGADINATCTDGSKILDSSLISPGLASFLVSRGARSDTPSGRIAHNTVSKLDLALGSGVDIDSEVRDGYNLLHLSCQTRDAELVWKLLKSGANVNCEARDGLMPLHIVLHENLESTPKDYKAATFKLVDILLDFGADLNLKDSKRGWSPFHQQAVYGCHSELDLFLDRGADINSKTRDGDTILHLTVRSDCWLSATFILMRGADINLKNNKGLTPMQYAMSLEEKQESGYDGLGNCIFAFLDHIRLLEYLGLYVCDENIQAVNHEEYSDWEGQRDVDLLDRVKLTGDVSLLDILRDKYPDSIFNKTDSETVKSLKSSGYEEMIQVKYRIAKERFDRMEASRRFLSQLIYETGTSKGWRVTCLPIELINKILSYLSVPHLKKLAEELMSREIN